MARDWLWRQASFDGVPFYVDTAELGRVGRHVVTHEYPGAEQHDNEDLGRPARKIEITAYFASETADADSQALIARLAQEGPGLLDLPMFGRMQVRATLSHAGWSREKLNYVGFPVRFVEETPTAALDPIAYGAALIGYVAAALPSAASVAIANALTGLAPTSWAVADSAAALASVSADVAALAPRAGASAAAALTTAVSDAVSALSAGPSADLPALAMALFDQVDALAAVAESPPFGAAAADIAGALSDAATASLADRAAALAAWDISDVSAIVPLAAAAVYAGEAARALAATAYADRPAAIAAREKVAALASLVAPLLTDAGLADAFAAATGSAAAQITRAALDLAPVVLVETSVSLPANVLAWKLYGDLGRSVELIDRNRVATPCFMPLQIEAAGA